MLQRVQLMLDTKTKEKLERLAKAEGRSMSHVARKILKNAITKSRNELKDNGQGLLRWSEGAISGPGGGNYDEYLYGKSK